MCLSVSSHSQKTTNLTGQILDAAASPTQVHDGTCCQTEVINWRIKKKFHENIVLILRLSLICNNDDRHSCSVFAAVVINVCQSVWSSAAVVSFGENLLPSAGALVELQRRFDKGGNGKKEARREEKEGREVLFLPDSPAIFLGRS